MACACNPVTETEEEETRRSRGLTGTLPSLFSKLWVSERHCLEEINKQEASKQTKNGRQSLRDHT